MQRLEWILITHTDRFEYKDVHKFLLCKYLSQIVILSKTQWSEESHFVNNPFAAQMLRLRLSMTT